MSKPFLLFKHGRQYSGQLPPTLRSPPTYFSEAGIRKLVEDGSVVYVAELIGDKLTVTEMRQRADLYAMQVGAGGDFTITEVKNGGEEK